MRSPVGAAAGAVRNRNRERHSPSRHALLIGSRSGLREKQACTTNISSRLPARHSGSELPARVHCVVLDAVFDRALHQTRPLCRAVHVLVALRAMERRGPGCQAARRRRVRTLVHDQCSIAPRRPGCTPQQQSCSLSSLTNRFQYNPIGLTFRSPSSVSRYPSQYCTSRSPAIHGLADMAMPIGLCMRREPRPVAHWRAFCRQSTAPHRVVWCDVAQPLESRSGPKCIATAAALYSQYPRHCCLHTHIFAF
jgi:hypothetical protein